MSKRLRVPIVDLAVQRQYGAAFRRLRAFEEAIADFAELGRDLSRGLAEGLVDGSLDPEVFHRP